MAKMSSNSKAVVTTAAGVALGAAVMPLDQFLKLLLYGGTGAAVKVALDYIKGRAALSGDATFWLANVLSFVIPGLAYAALVGLEFEPLTWQGAFTAVAMGFMASQAVNRVVPDGGDGGDGGAEEVEPVDEGALVLDGRPGGR